MTFIDFDAARAAHHLARIQSAPELRADALFERLSEQRVGWSNREAPRPPTVRLRREQGLAVRLRSPTRSWLESRDGLSGGIFDEALRRVARSLPALPLPELDLRGSDWPPLDQDLDRLPRRLEEEIRRRRVGFPFSVELAIHRREVLPVDADLAAEAQSEQYLEIEGTFEGGSIGALLPLSQGWPQRAVDLAAGLMVERFRARRTQPPPGGVSVVVLGPNAAAVLLHEAVAHALEADLLSLSGGVRDAVGVRLAPAFVDLLDDPAAAPGPVARSHDDEGTPTIRRWLLREGVVRQPLADRSWSARCPSVDPGAGRRATRHDPPGPRSTFLQLLPGEESSLLDEGPGIWVDQILRGSLQPVTGEVRLVAACGRIFRNGDLGERVGSFEIRGRVADLLGAIAAVGREPVECGAGWCAKDGQRMPVWASAPGIRLDGVEVIPR